MQDAAVLLKNGRRISYHECGNKKGYPILYFHGLTSSRISGISANAIAQKMNIRLIAIDRPGIGLSTPHHIHSIYEWTTDVKKLVDRLKLHTFSVVGHSGGGAYALASAYTLAERIDKVGVVGSTIPFTSAETQNLLPRHLRYFRKMAKYIPWGFSGIIALLRLLFLKRTEKVFAANLKVLPDADQKILLDQKIKGILVASAVEACRQGGQGISQDAYLLSSDWGFDVRKISKKITIWHGTDDLTIPFPAGNYLHTLLPNSELIPEKNQGHLFLFSHWDSILERFI